MFQTFDKIKNKFKSDGGHLELISEDRYDDVTDMMADHFVKDEKLCAAFGVQTASLSARILRRLILFVCVEA